MAALHALAACYWRLEQVVQGSMAFLINLVQSVET